MSKTITYDDIKKANSEIKMLDVKGRDYAEVPQRLTAYRKVYPKGGINTEILSIADGIVVMKCTVTDEDGCLLGTGHAYEKENSTFINRTSYIENCETSAIGRALGAAGFGSDTSMASAEEVLNAQKQQKKLDEDSLKAELKGLLMSTNSDTTAFLAWCTEKFEREIKAVDEMHDLELKEAIRTVRRKGTK